MLAREETAALVALLRVNDRTPAQLAGEVEAAGSAHAVLGLESARSGEEEHEASPRLFDLSAPTPDIERALIAARRDLEEWQARGIDVRTVLDSGYPANLRTAHDRPALVFSSGADAVIREMRAVAVVGARDASPVGLQLAGDISTRLAALEYVVVSGLASGIDTAAHTSVLRAGGRTLAVTGTGLDHAYPPQNAGLQRAIATRGALISQFWPATPPHPAAFPLRNALMSGLTRGTIIVEAGARSGTRIQARAALAQGRPVFLHESLLNQSWAQELARVANVHVIDGGDQAAAILERLRCIRPLTA